VRHDSDNPFLSNYCFPSHLQISPQIEASLTLDFLKNELEKSIHHYYLLNSFIHKRLAFLQQLYQDDKSSINLVFFYIETALAHEDFNFCHVL